MPPPLSSALLPDRVVLVSLATPKLAIPPPSSSALLPQSVALVSTRTPPTLNYGTAVNGGAVVSQRGVVSVAEPLTWKMNAAVCSAVLDQNSLVERNGAAVGKNSPAKAGGSVARHECVGQCGGAADADINGAAIVGRGVGNPRVGQRERIVLPDGNGAAAACITAVPDGEPVQRRRNAAGALDLHAMNPARRCRYRRNRRRRCRRR